MSFRVVVATLLIILGIASPWIVRDCLNPVAEECFSSRFYGAVSDTVSNISAKVEEKFATDDGVVVSGEEAGPEAEPLQIVEATDSTGTSIETYPFANKTWRVIQGFFSPDSSAVSRDAGKGNSTLSASSTMRAEAITESVGKSLEGELSRLSLALGDPLYVRIFKEESELEIWMKAKGKPHYSLFKIMRLTDYAGKPGPKLREGDGQAPEGFYYVTASQLRPDTRNYLGIDLGFPNAFDSSLGRSGSDLLIHGGDNAAGSFALSHSDIGTLYTIAHAALANGQDFFRVNIFPFRMTDRRMDSEWQKKPKWLNFWVNLKEGYDFFENANFPPDAEVEGGKYVFRIR